MALAAVSPHAVQLVVRPGRPGAEDLLAVAEELDVVVAGARDPAPAQQRRAGEARRRAGRQQVLGRSVGARGHRGRVAGRVARGVDGLDEVGVALAVAQMGVGEARTRSVVDDVGLRSTRSRGTAHDHDLGGPRGLPRKPRGPVVGAHRDVGQDGRRGVVVEDERDGSADVARFVLAGAGEGEAGAVGAGVGRGGAGGDARGGVDAGPGRGQGVVVEAPGVGESVGVGDDGGRCLVKPIVSRSCCRPRSLRAGAVGACVADQGRRADPPSTAAGCCDRPVDHTSLRTNPWPVGPYADRQRPRTAAGAHTSRPPPPATPPPHRATRRRSTRAVNASNVALASARTSSERAPAASVRARPASFVAGGALRCARLRRGTRGIAMCVARPRVARALRAGLLAVRRRAVHGPARPARRRPRHGRRRPDGRRHHAAVSPPDARPWPWACS